MPLKAPLSEPNACAFGFRRVQAVASLIIAAAAFSVTTANALADRPTLTINGSAARAAELERNSHVFVPAQSVFSQLGETVTYQAPHAVVKSKSGLELARMTLGSRDASVKGSPQMLAAAPFAAHGQLMVPLRFVSEAAGAVVAYSASPRAITIQNSMPVAGATRVGAPAAVVAQANPAPQASGVATAPAVATQADSGGIPGWVWLLAALVILGLVLAFFRRKKEPLIRTSRTGRSGEPTIITRK